MSDSILSQPQFHDEEAARKHLESIRWPNGPICPHCGGTERNSPLNGESHRDGLYFCGDCRTQFTVTVGTVFERSKVPLHKWVLATHLICSSKKGMSSHQLHRILGVTYKTAWFMTHRIREAMKTKPSSKLGGNGGIVEVDETFVGRKPGSEKRRGHGHKEPVFSLVERNGKVRSYHVCDVKAETLRPILMKQIHKDTHIMSDDAVQYPKACKSFKKHSSVNHSAGEYSRGKAHTNTVEGYFSILKRGVIGTYHHLSSHHLHRYVTEFDFRYNHREISDSERSISALKGIDGKRLTYRRPHNIQTHEAWNF